MRRHTLHEATDGDLAREVLRRVREECEPEHDHSGLARMLLTGLQAVALTADEANYMLAALDLELDHDDDSDPPPKSAGGSAREKVIGLLEEAISSGRRGA